MAHDETTVEKIRKPRRYPSYNKLRRHLKMSPKEFFNDDPVQIEINKKTLDPLAFQVTQNNGTERPFENPFWNDHREGIYVDVVSGEPLFSSTDKFDSDCGWPSFSRPLSAENVVEKKDLTHFMIRIEVRSKIGNSHLGHVFNDGPPPTKLRYCINSAALKFVPREQLAEAGYGRFMSLFTEKQAEPVPSGGDL
jgi:methionine-R-sulfoxide reductase